SANLLLDKAKELSKGNPIVVTGDFNATVDEEPIQIITDMTNSKHLTDARSKAHIVYGPNWTFHDFGRLDQAKRNIIDYIFVSSNIKVISHGIISETLNGLYLSDHNPIVSKIEF
ncbi:MAG: endonuclease/exonuclease/phosphatase family protein, partial [Tannerellaceae bacterium]